MLLFLASFVALVLVVGLGLYGYLQLQEAWLRPSWRRLPARPGLPPDMEYECWTPLSYFDPGELSDAIVVSMNLLAPVIGRTTLFAALRGARVLVYALGTYPGDECTPIAIAWSGPARNGAREMAVEQGLVGVAHAIVHLVERYSGRNMNMAAQSLDLSHASWASRGITDAVAAYERKRAQYA